MLLMPLLLLLPMLLLAQTKTVTGTVKDAKGNPLPGVSVLLKGTITGTTTDATGKFSISVAQGATLVLSFIGYENNLLTVGSKDNYTIALKEKTGELSDVVVNVGYGRQKKVDLTGSVSVIDKQMLENRPITNAVAALQGASPGLIITRSSGQPGLEGYNINIRGVSSLNGTNTALVVIDGVAGGDLSLLNPYDIESISVLKDAASAAIYGAQAAGGVILVTTKKGAANKKIRLDYTGIVTDNTRYNVPALLQPWQQALMVDTAQAHAAAGQSWAPWKIRVMQSDTSYLPAGTNLSTTPPTIPASYTGYDYYKYFDPNMFLRNNTYSANHNLTASGGNENSQYLFGFGYYTQNGVFAIGPDRYDRYNARLNINTKLNNIFSFSTNLGYTFSKTLQSVGGGQISGDNGILYNIYSRASSGVQTGTIFLPGTNLIANATGGDIYGALSQGGYNTTRQHTLNGIFNLAANNIAKGVSVNLIYAPSLQQTNQDILAQDYYLYQVAGADGITTTTSTKNDYSGSGSSNTTSGNYISKYRTTQFTNDIQALANYDLKFGGAHHIHALVGFEYSEYNFNNDFTKVTNLVSTNTGSLNFLSGNSVTSASDNVQTNAWVSYFGRVNYDYKDKYLLQVNLRDDGSSKLAPGYRSQTFPSASAGWRISQESWFKNNISFVNELKIRGSYGTLGNAVLSANNQHNYDYISLLSQGANVGFGSPNTPISSYYQASLPSLGKGWETIKTTDIGIDLSLFRSRLNITFDDYKKNNNDMLITINYPATLGVGAAQTNSASLVTKGWETSVAWSDRIGKFTYSIAANLSDNTNKLTNYAGTTTIGQGTNSTIVGQPLNSIYGYKDLGYFKDQNDVNNSPFIYAKTGPGDIKYANLDGNKYVDATGRPVINSGAGTVADHGDLTYLGNTNPRYTFGVNLQAGYAGFDVQVFFQGVGKREMLIPTRTMVPFVQTYRAPWAEQMDAWTPTNTNAKFPRLYWYGSDAVETAMNGAISSHWVQNASYISLKNLQVGYTIPYKLLSRMKIQKIRLFFTAQDLWRITGMWYKAFDPENPNNAAWNYPFFRSYAAGLNVSF